MSSSTAASRRLLVVEDDPGLNALITRKLQKAGYRVESVLTGAAALDAVRRDPSALVLLDYLLPDMTAHDIVKKLKAEGQELRFAVMTGHGDEKVAVELMKMGARDYLVKDSDLGDVLPLVVRHVLDQLATEERLAATEATLRVSEGRFRTAFENASVGMLLTSLDGRLITVNRTLCRMLGYTEQELTGRNAGAVTHPDDVAMCQEAVRSLLAGEVVSCHLEKRHLHKAGHVIWTDLSISLVRDADGVPLHFVALIQDITERKRAEQALQRSERDLRVLAQNLPAIVYRVHLRDRNRMEFFNDMLNQMTGYREDELHQGEVCSIDPLILPEDHASVVEIVKRAVSESRPFHVDYRVTHRDGTIRHFSEQGRPVPGADGRPEFIDGVIFDETEAQLSAEMVKQGQERLAEAQRTSHLGSWLWDVRAQKSFWSAELFRILGLEPDSVPPTQTSFLARVHPDDRAYFEARVAEAARTRSSYEFDLRVVRPDGVERHVHCETNVEYDAAGEPALVSGTCQDVTERRQAELALRAEKERAQEYLDIASVMLIAMDTAGTVTLINHRGCEVLGCSEREALGKDWFEVFLPERTQTEMRVVFRHLLAGEPVGPEYAECLVRTCSGDERVIAWHDQLLHDRTGRVTGILSSGEDVTERKRAEQALRASEERFRRTAENVPDGLLVVDGRQVSFANRRLEDIFGFSRDEILQMGMMGPVAPEDRERAMETVAENVRNGKSSFELEFRIVRKDGARRCVQCRYALGGEPGQPPRRYIVVTDVTERRQAEDDLRREQERAQEYLDVAGNMFVVLDPQGRIIRVNQSACDVLGWTEHDLVGKNWFDTCLPERSRAEVRDIHQRVLSDADDAEYVEHTVLTRDGTERLIAWHNTVLKDAQGNFEASLSSGEDITDRRRAADALVRQHKMTEALIDSPEDIVIFSLDRDYRYTAFNEPHRKEILKVYGADIKVGMNILEVINIPEARQKAKQSLDRVLAGESFNEVQVQPGLDTCYEFNWNPIRTDTGKVIGVAAFIRDITERKRAEEALRVVQQRREQLESIVDRSPAVAFLWRTDPQLTVDFVSANVSQFGYEVDEFLSGRLHYIDIIHPEDRGSEGPKVAQYVVAGTVEFVQEYRIFTKAGEVRWVEDHTWVPRDPDGSVSHHQGIIVDVTARRQAERALRESEEFRRRILDTSPDCIEVLDLEGRLLFMNEGGRRLLEIDDLSAILNTSWPDFWKGTDHQIALGAVAAARAGGAGVFEGFCPRNKGTPKWWDVVIMPMVGSDGKPERLLAASRDITGRKQAEQALHRSEERYRHLVEEMGEGVASTDGDERFILANRAAEELFGVPRGGLVGRNLLEFLDTEQAEIVRGRTARRRSGEKSPYELAITRPDGTRQTALVTATPRHDAAGEYVGASAIFRDITARRKAEQLARDERDQLLRILDAMPDGAYVVGQDYEVQYVNPALLASGGPVNGRKCHKYFHNRDGVCPDCVNPQVFTGAASQSEYTTRQGVVYEIQNVPVTGNDGRPARLVFMRDISERRRGEKKLRHYTDDLALLNQLDAAINRGESLDATFEVLKTETQKLFGGRGATLFLVSEDRQYLELANPGLPGNEIRMIEKVLGVGMPRVRVALKPGGFHTTVLEIGQARILSDAKQLERWAGEMTESTAIRKLVPALRRLLKLDSALLAPLASSGRPIGMLTVARHEPFSEDDLRRFSAIAEQMAVAIGRKLADDALRTSEEKYRLVVEHANEAILVVQDERIRFVNSRTSEVFGYSPEELRGRPFPSFIHPDDRAMVMDRHRKRLRGEPIPDRYAFRIVRNDGTVRWVEIGATVTTWYGQPASLSFLSDVTDRELAAGRESQQRWDKAFLAETAVEFVRLGEQEDIYQHICSRLHILAGDAYVIVNSHDSKADEFQVRAVAGLEDRLDTVLKLMGRKPEGSVFTLTPKEKQEYASDKLKRIAGGLAGLSLGKLPKRLSALLEKTFDIGDVYAMTLFYQGAILGTVNILLRRGKAVQNLEVVETFLNQAAVALQRRLIGDELRRHEHNLGELVEERTKELKQAQDALVVQERLAAIGKVAGSMAHEIRNPLAAMRNATYFLTDALGSQLGERAARHLEIINQEIDIANGIITSVLDFARGRPTVLAPLNLAGVLDIAQERTDLPAGIEVQRSIPPDLPMVRVDRRQMVQVFINLLTNASQAMDGKGRITVSARELRVEESKVDKSKGQGSKVEIRFRDEGPGIAPENLERVFEPLFSTRTVGIGMGLAVCKAFVEAGEGTIEVESESGKGATFIVTLPATSSKQ